MRLLKLDPMTLLVLVVALGVVVTMTTQASTRKSVEKDAVAMVDAGSALNAVTSTAAVKVE
jgi:hypothetical protein